LRPSLSSRGIETFFLVFLGVGIAFFLINALFAHPWTDDYIFSSISRDKGFIESLGFWYNNITGRYFSVSLMLVNPMVYGKLWGYKLVPFLLVFALFGTFYFLVNEVTKGCFYVRGKVVFVLALLFVYCDQMPDIRSGLYWIAGTFTYLTGAILLLLLVVVMFRILNLGEDGGGLLALSGVVLGFCLPGTNEVILAVLIPVVVFFLWLDYRRRHKINRHLLFILAAIFAGSCFALLAPGNAMRLGSYAGSRNTPQAMIQAATTTFSSLLLWFGTPQVIALTLVVVKVTPKLSLLKAMSSEVPPLNSFVLLVLFIFGCFFPPYWSMGTPPPDRVVNMIYLFFLVGWLLNVAVMTTWLSPQLFAGIRWLSMTRLLSCLTVYALVFFTFGHSNTVVVIGDLLSGRSYCFDRELQQRYDWIKADPSPVCAVAVLQNTPQSLFFSDIYFVNSDWINQSYADYYGKRSIFLKRVQTVR
jgi:hypothetical protein